MTTILSFSPSVKTISPLGEAIAGLYQQVSTIQSDFEGLDAVDLDEAEKRLDEAIHTIARAAKAEILARLRPNPTVFSMEGRTYKRCKQPSNGIYFTLHGPVTIERHLYREVGVRNGATLDPIAMRAGLLNKTTPRASSCRSDILEQPRFSDAIRDAVVSGTSHCQRACGGDLQDHRIHPIQAGRLQMEATLRSAHPRSQSPRDLLLHPDDCQTIIWVK